MKGKKVFCRNGGYGIVVQVMGIFAEVDFGNGATGIRRLSALTILK